MQIVRPRNQETLLTIIADICRPGTTVASDMWRAYRNLSRKLGMQHRTVNHSLNFVNPVDGTHTQTIESYWAKQKDRIQCVTKLYQCAKRKNSIPKVLYRIYAKLILPTVQSFSMLNLFMYLFSSVMR
ncbi:hypothetical protein PAPHI01_2580 [Pancytospora philotis]|nr:hypothetical protein PAPHI01_2580 [Pancytospora philotis]